MILRCCMPLLREEKSIITREGRQKHSKTMIWLVSSVVYSLSLVALITLATLTVAGVLPSTTLAWSAVSLGGGSYLCLFLQGALNTRKISLLTGAGYTAGCVVLAILGLTGVLPSDLMGIGLLCVGGVQMLYQFGTKSLFLACEKHITNAASKSPENLQDSRD